MMRHAGEIENGYWSALASAVTRQAGSLHLDSVHAKLGDLRQRVRERHPIVDRIAFALYDPRDDVLRGILGGDRPGDQLPPPYSRRLQTVPSLAEMARTRSPRVLNDLELEISAGSEHSRWLLTEGFRSSLTTPVEQDGALLGFLFFDSRKPHAFQPAVVDDLLLLAYLIAMLVRQELGSVERLVGSLRLARQFADLRDIETGAHLDRMSHYAHLIAREIAADAGKSPDFVDLLHLYAPLHDIGKVGVPDSILHKPGKLDAGERAIMNSHVPLGVTMADRLLADFGLHDIDSVSMLRNVIAHHHEFVDGSGYPGKLTGSDIPLESRIVAAADVLDALSCKRSYKPAWKLGDALAEVQRMSGRKLDEACVNALMNCRDEVEEIHHTFHEAA